MYLHHCKGARMMNKLLNFSALLSLILIQGCSPDEAARTSTDSPAQEPTKQALVVDKVSATHYALRGADDSWPEKNGEEIALADDKTARNFYLVFDGSGSMNSNKCTDGSTRITTAKNTVKQFLNFVPKDSNLGLFVFDNYGAKEVSALQPINVPLVAGLIDKVEAGRGTPIGIALTTAYNKLSLQGQKQQSYGEYNIVVITDGEATNSVFMDQVVKRIVANSPINIHTIGFCIGASHALNKPGIINYQSASNAKELLTGLTGVLAEAPEFNANLFEDDSNE